MHTVRAYGYGQDAKTLLTGIAMIMNLYSGKTFVRTAAVSAPVVFAGAKVADYCTVYSKVPVG